MKDLARETALGSQGKLTRVAADSVMFLAIGRSGSRWARGEALEETGHGGGDSGVALLRCRRRFEGPRHRAAPGKALGVGVEDVDDQRSFGVLISLHLRAAIPAVIAPAGVVGAEVDLLLRRADEVHDEIGGA